MSLVEIFICSVLVGFDTKAQIYIQLQCNLGYRPRSVLSFFLLLPSGAFVWYKNNKK